ncbi:hypothetical protein SAMN05216383_105176 [Prevotella sp. KH2C16]|nr:hypothetical protein SAMN05216383_105176 [Prevotella sp. KH2C16]
MEILFFCSAVFCIAMGIREIVLYFREVGR